MDFRLKGVDWKVKVGASKLTKFCMFSLWGEGKSWHQVRPTSVLIEVPLPYSHGAPKWKWTSTFLHLANMCIQALRGLLRKVDRRQVACWRYERWMCKGWKSTRNQPHHYSSIEDRCRILKFDWNSLHEGADRIESKGPSDPFILQTLSSQFYKKRCIPKGSHYFLDSLHHRAALPTCKVLLVCLLLSASDTLPLGKGA